MKGFVYTLSCPIDNTIKYVGMTTNPLEYRLQGHLFNPTPNNKEWIKSLKKQGLRPIIEMLEEIDGEKKDLALAEKYWIGQLSTWGFVLTNSIKYTKFEYAPKREIRILNPSDELLKAIEKQAIIENRTLTNMAETALNTFFKIKPRL